MSADTRKNDMGKSGVKPLTWRSNLATALRDERMTWLFVLRALLSLMITGWLAMRFNLASPSTAMLTTVLILNQRSGLIIAKSFYRILGTAAGGIASIALIAMFGQHRELFLLGFGGWLGICAGGAAYLRNFKSYGFVLAGYTTCFITLSSYHDPLTVFNATVARGSEVMLGIIVTTIINEIIFPVRMGQDVWKALDQQFDDVLAYIRAGLPGIAPDGRIQSAHASFIRQAVQLENSRSSAIFESTEIAARSTVIQHINRWFMRTTTSLYSFYSLIMRLQKQCNETSLRETALLYEKLRHVMESSDWKPSQADLLLEQLKKAKKDISHHMDASLGHFQHGSDEYMAFDTSAGLLIRIIEELEQYFSCLDRLYHSRSRLFHFSHPPFKRITDIAPSLINGIRAFVAVQIMGIFWFMADWHMGENALLNTGIYCTLFASMPNPAKGTLQVTYGYGLACITTFIYLFEIMPRLDGFLLMFTAYVPFIMLGYVAMTRPKYFAIGLGYVICIVYITGFQNPQTYNVLDYLNNVVAQMVGMGSAIVAFMIIPAAGTFGWVNSRIQKKIYKLVSFAAFGPLMGLAQRFESGSYDLFNQLMSQMADSGHDEMMTKALAINEVGQTLIEVRTIVSRRSDLTDDIQRAIRSMVIQVSLLYRHPSHERYVKVLNALAYTDHEIRSLPGQDKNLERHFYLLCQIVKDANGHIEYDIKKSGNG